ncbi:MAG TPA: GGDEF domain-containing protein [Candidatus Handelsmanbacteria bacterium]|nr:GGDEF domain-containing protein [Candidatus Handelsmanbacteria bacterium]
MVQWVSREIPQPCQQEPFFYQPCRTSGLYFESIHRIGRGLIDVLRDYVGRLFGFDAEILGLREKVRELSWDDAYHMYTRPAFLQFAQIMPRGRRILAFIDLDDIHRLDQELGYTEVDRRVQSTFSVSFRRSDIVARWYSGDEIVILFDSERDGAERKMEELAVAGRAEGLTFKFAIGDWDVGKDAVEKVIEELSHQVTLQKEDTNSDSSSSR